jgi:hypothetical protein
LGPELRRSAPSVSCGPGDRRCTATALRRRVISIRGKQLARYLWRIYFGADSVTAMDQGIDLRLRADRRSPVL